MGRIHGSGNQEVTPLTVTYSDPMGDCVPPVPATLSFAESEVLIANDQWDHCYARRHKLWLPPGHFGLLLSKHQPREHDSPYWQR